MSKTDFLEQLRQSLSGRMEADRVMEHLRYYEDYINIQLRSGRSEEEILAGLGSPRLIAKTITDTHGDSGAVYEEEKEKPVNNVKEKALRWLFQLPGWAKACIILTVIFCLIWIIMSLLAFLAPVLIPLLIVLFLMKMFRDWLK